MSRRETAATLTIGRALDARGKLSSLLQKHTMLVLFFSIISALYVGMTFAAPLNSSSTKYYHLTELGSALVILSVEIPLLAIWGIALVGYMRMQDYAGATKSDKDGQAFWLISRGILLLAIWLPLSGFLSLLQRYVYNNHPAAVPQAVYFNNYVNVAVLLAASLFVYFGTRRLLAIVHATEPFGPLGIASYIAFASFYTFLVLQDPARQVPTAHMEAATFYTPDWVTILTIVIPRLVTWGIGFQAAYNLFAYRMKVKGKIYRESLTGLAIGIAGVMVSLAVLRCVQTLGARLSGLSLSTVLILVYVLMALIAVGFIAIAAGAKTLQRIENI